MRYVRKRQTKFVAAVICMIVMMIAASRQLYLFVVFNDAQSLLGTQGGRHHLWFAVSAALLACLAGGLMFFFFLSDGDKNKDLYAGRAT